MEFYEFPGGGIHAIGCKMAQAYDPNRISEEEVREHALKISECNHCP